jgi:hypothetical protein
MEAKKKAIAELCRWPQFNPRIGLVSELEGSINRGSASPRMRKTKT